MKGSPPYNLPPPFPLLTREVTFHTVDLRFVCSPERSLSVAGPPTEKWALVDVTHNNTRGSSQRLREKREKIRQATHRPSSDSKEESEKCVQSFVSDASGINYLIDICGLYIP